MKIIGITGGTGAGKTTALNELATLDFCIIDCDALYHRLLEEDVELLDELKRRFPPAFVSGQLDIKALGNIVFQNPDELAALNGITHRFVIREVKAELKQAETEGRVGGAIDAIALIESGLGRLCSAVVGIIAPTEERVRRIMIREGISRQYAESRVNAQQPDRFFRKNCDYILENSGSQEAFAKRSRALFLSILAE